MKKEVIEALNTIKTFLGMEKEVKLMQMKLVDGMTTIEAEEFEVGYPINVVAEDGSFVPLPVGDYELEDGRFLVISEDGIIGEIKEAPAQEEQAPMEQPEAEVPVEAEAQTERQPKRVVESKEYHFSAEEVQVLKDEIENLKKEIIDLKSEKHVELSTEDEATDIVEFAEVKPIQFNPENEQKVEGFIKPQNTDISNILSKVYN